MIDAGENAAQNLVEIRRRRHEISIRNTFAQVILLNRRLGVDEVLDVGANLGVMRAAVKSAVRNLHRVERRKNVVKFLDAVGVGLRGGRGVGEFLFDFVFNRLVLLDLQRRLDALDGVGDFGDNGVAVVVPIRRPNLHHVPTEHFQDRRLTNLAVAGGAGARRLVAVGEDGEDVTILVVGVAYRNIHAEARTADLNV